MQYRYIFKAHLPRTHTQRHKHHVGRDTLESREVDGPLIFLELKVDFEESLLAVVYGVTIVSWVVQVAVIWQEYPLNLTYKIRPFD